MGRKSKLRQLRAKGPEAELILHVQEIASGYEDSVCVGPVDGDWSVMTVTRQNAHLVPEVLQRWVPPLSCTPQHLHPVFVDRSPVTGKWRVVLIGRDGLEVLDVFNDRLKALRSAQNAQEVFGAYHLSMVSRSSCYWASMVMKYAMEDADEGIESGDEVIAEFRDSGEGDGFRELQAGHNLCPQHVGHIVNELRLAGVHVRAAAPGAAS